MLEMNAFLIKSQLNHICILIDCYPLPNMIKIFLSAIADGPVSYLKTQTFLLFVSLKFVQRSKSLDRRDITLAPGKFLYMIHHLDYVCSSLPLTLEQRELNFKSAVS